MSSTTEDKRGIIKDDAKLIERSEAGEDLNSWEAARLVFLTSEPWWKKAPVGGWQVDSGIPECDESLPDRLREES